MNVSIGGEVVRREAEPVHLYDRTGKPIATHMRPRLLPGEVLVDRLGTYPAIIQEQA